MGFRGGRITLQVGDFIEQLKTPVICAYIDVNKIVHVVVYLNIYKKVAKKANFILERKVVNMIVVFHVPVEIKDTVDKKVLGKITIVNLTSVKTLVAISCFEGVLNNNYLNVVVLNSLYENV